MQLCFIHLFSIFVFQVSDSSVSDKPVEEINEELATSPCSMQDYSPTVTGKNCKQPVSWVNSQGSAVAEVLGFNQKRHLVANPDVRKSENRISSRSHEYQLKVQKSEDLPSDSCCTSDMMDGAQEASITAPILQMMCICIMKWISPNCEYVFLSLPQRDLRRAM